MLDAGAVAIAIGIIGGLVGIVTGVQKFWKTRAEARTAQQTKDANQDKDIGKARGALDSQGRRVDKLEEDLKILRSKVQDLDVQSAETATLQKVVVDRIKGIESDLKELIKITSAQNNN